MLPPWALAAFYVVGGAIVVWSLLRIWQRRKLAHLERDASWPQANARPSPPPNPLQEPQTTQTFAAPAPQVVTILKPVAATPVQPANSSRSIADAAPTWQRERLFGDVAVETDSLPRVLAEDVPVSRSDDYVFGDATPFLAAMLPESKSRREQTRSELISAGYYAPHALQNLAAVRYLSMFGGLVLALLLLLMAPPRLEWIAVCGVIALPLLGWALPRLYVRGQAVDRRSEIERGMPDLLDMLNMCVSQGLTIPDALRRILRDLRGPYPALAQELRIVADQAAIGNLHQALENFSRRLDIPEVHSFTSLLTQTERMGTSISEALTSYSDTMRESLRQRADEKGNRATFQLLFPTVLCLMPAVYLFLLGPAIVDLSNFFNAGGRDALDQGGARAIQQLNTNRTAVNTPGQAP